MQSAQKGNCRGPNIRPTKAAVARYLRLLKDKADQGDIHAAGWLIQLHSIEQALMKDRRSKMEP